MDNGGHWFLLLCYLLMAQSIASGFYMDYKARKGRIERITRFRKRLLREKGLPENWEPPGGWSKIL